MSSNTPQHTYTVETVKVSDLDVDRAVQRDELKPRKVEMIVRNYNRDALGVLHVSRRRTANGALVGMYVIDGWHRMEATRRVTDNTGEMTAHVYDGLTLAEEAAMFLALNDRTAVTALDKHKVRVAGGDEQALRIEEAVRAYGWKVSGVPADGNVNAIIKLYAIDELSQALEMEPDLIRATFLVITRAWGTDRHAAQSVILEGLASLFAEHGSHIDVPYLIERLKVYPGGAATLHAEATHLARVTHTKVSMMVASQITDWYNKPKGARSKTLLHKWGRKSMPNPRSVKAA